MISTEELLERAAKDGTFEAEEWPRALETILLRLDEIVHHEFPIPAVSTIIHPPAPPPESAVPPESSNPASDISSSSHATNKENAPPSSPPQIPPTLNSTYQIPSLCEMSALPDGTLPAPLLSKLTFIKRALSVDFARDPPYTIQRLAELVLHPKQHYRFLPPYLSALDRVVSVSSGITSFPLPIVELAPASGTPLNGHVASAVNGDLVANMDNTLGSDESLGGALLTPIPWLRQQSSSPTSTITRMNGYANAADLGPTGDVDITAGETLRGNGGVTQGELLRQEQVATDPPAAVGSASSRQHISSTGDNDEYEDPIQEYHVHPHARGPENIGAEDIGSQGHAVGSGQVLDMEAAVGRSIQVIKEEDHKTMSVKTQPDVAPGNEGVQDRLSPEGLKKAPSADADGDLQIVNADGITDPGMQKNNVTASNNASDIVNAAVE